MATNDTNATADRKRVPKKPSSDSKPTHTTPAPSRPRQDPLPKEQVDELFEVMTSTLIGLGRKFGLLPDNASHYASEVVVRRLRAIYGVKTRR